jgi:hypothetical protein
MATFRQRVQRLRESSGGKRPQTDWQKRVARYRQNIAGREISSVDDFLEAWGEEDVDKGELLLNIPGDILQSLADIPISLLEAATSPVETAKGLGSLAVGVADLPLRMAGMETTHPIQQQGREMLGGIASQTAKSLTPSELEKRPVRPFVDIASLFAGGSGALLKGLGQGAKLARMPQAAQALSKAGGTAFSAAPEMLAMRAAGAGYRKGKKVAGDVVRRGAKAVSGGVVGMAKRAHKDIKVPGVKLWDEVVSGIESMTTGAAKNLFQMQFDAARQGLGGIIKKAREGREGTWDGIVKTLSLGAAKSKEAAQKDYTKVKKQIKDSGLGNINIPDVNVAEFVVPTLRKFGIDLVRKAEMIAGSSIMISGKKMMGERVPGPEKWVVEGLDDSKISMLGDNRRIIKRHIENVLNPDTGSLTVDHLWSKLDEVRDSISILSRADDVSSRTRALLSQLQSDLSNTVYGVFEANGISTEFLQKYTKAMIDIDEWDSMLGIRPGMVDKKGNLAEGLDLNVVGKLKQSFQDTKADALFRLKKLEKWTDDVNEQGKKLALARMTGVMTHELFGAGLVGKNQAHQALRAMATAAGAITVGGLGFGLAGVGAGMGVLMGGLVSVPAMFMFLPRPVTSINLKLYGPNKMFAGRRKAADAKLKTMIKKVRELNQTLRPIGIDLKKIAQEGITIGAFMERLQQVVDEEDKITRR